MRFALMIVAMFLPVSICFADGGIGESTGDEPPDPVVACQDQCSEEANNCKFDMGLYWRYEYWTDGGNVGASAACKNAIEKECRDFESYCVNECKGNPNFANQLVGEWVTPLECLSGDFNPIQDPLI